MKKVIIIGAGPAGITAGYELLKKSSEYDVKILEESPYVGGISRTVEYNGHRMDLGGHRFFSKSKEVNDWWEEIMPMQGAPSYDDAKLGREIMLTKGGPDPEQENRVMLTRNRISHIYYNNKFFDYPIKMNADTLKNMGLGSTMQAGFSYMGSMITKKPETSLENFYINQFGKKLYSMFFEGYTEKLWGRHPSEIDPSWGAQRTKGLSISTVLKESTRKVLHKESEEVVTSLIESFKYPKLGPGQLWETAADEFVKMGGTIHFNCEVIRVNTNGNKVESVVCAVDGVTVEEKADIVISSMPIKNLIVGMNDVPGNVTEVAQKLPYRDFVTVGLLVPNLSIKNTTTNKTLGNIVPDTWIYVQDTGVKMGRIQIFNNWSPYLVEDPENTVWIGLEYFCNEGDRYWNMTEEEWVKLATKELIHMGIISDCTPVFDSHKVTVKKAYPAYFDTYERFDEIREYLDRFDNLYCVGRNGQHRYNNMDHSMMTAFETVKNIIDGVKDKSNIWDVNTEQEYHEEKTEQDALVNGNVSAEREVVSSEMLKIAVLPETDEADSSENSQMLEEPQDAPVKMMRRMTPNTQVVAPVVEEAVDSSVDVETSEDNNVFVSEDTNVSISSGTSIQVVIDKEPEVLEAKVQAVPAPPVRKPRVMSPNVVVTEPVRVVESEPVVEEVQVAESEPVVEEVQVAESELVVEEVQVVESEPVVEEVRVAESEPVVEEVQVAESEPVVEEVQVAESESVVEEAKPTESKPVIFRMKSEIKEPINRFTETPEPSEPILRVAVMTEESAPMAEEEKNVESEPVRFRMKSEADTPINRFAVKPQESETINRFAVKPEESEAVVDRKEEPQATVYTIEKEDSTSLRFNTMLEKSESMAEGNSENASDVQGATRTLRRVIEIKPVDSLQSGATVKDVDSEVAEEPFKNDAISENSNIPKGFSVVKRERRTVTAPVSESETTETTNTKPMSIWDEVATAEANAAVKTAPIIIKSVDKKAVSAVGFVERQFGTIEVASLNDEMLNQEKDVVTEASEVVSERVPVEAVEEEFVEETATIESITEIEPEEIVEEPQPEEMADEIETVESIEEIQPEEVAEEVEPVEVIEESQSVEVAEDVEPAEITEEMKTVTEEKTETVEDEEKKVPSRSRRKPKEIEAAEAGMKETTPTRRTSGRKKSANNAGIVSTVGTEATVGNLKGTVIKSNIIQMVPGDGRQSGARTSKTSGKMYRK